MAPKKERNYVDEVASTEAGRVVLRELMKLCGFTEVSAVRNLDGSVDSGPLFFNEGRRSVYLDIRKFVSPKNLRIIENPEPEAKDAKE